MKTIAIIPARGGSKRIPEKNIQLLGGLPLLAYSINYAKNNSQIIDAIYVSTDDASIKEVALRFGAKVIDRPEALSGDAEPTVTAMKHVLENIDESVENVILLQPTNPLRTEELLTEAYTIFENEKHNSLFTVTRNYQKFGKISNNQFNPFNYTIGQRSQDLDPLYFENGLLYITKADLILKHIIVSETAFPMIIDHPFGLVDIDTQEELEYAEYLYKKFTTQNS